MKTFTLQSTQESAPAKTPSKTPPSPVPVSPWLSRPVSGMNSPMIQRKRCACGGGCPTCREPNGPESVQTKLAVSTPGDQFEREADHVAEQIMRMPDSMLQRQCKDCADASPSESEESHIHRQANSGGAVGEMATDFTSRLGAGAPLDTASRRYFEPRFGHDFGDVRIHEGAAAATAAASVQARAFTLGRDVVFGAGEHNPGSDAGKRLLAHELTHVVQQSGSNGLPVGNKSGLHTASATHIQREPVASEPEPQSNAGAPATSDANASGDEGQNGSEEIEWTSQGPSGAGSGAGGAETLQQPPGAAPAAGATGEITLETGNVGAGPINNLVHQQICVTTGGGDSGKDCFSFAASGAQLPQFSSTWLGWSSYVVGAILQGEIYNPGAVPGATVVSRHTPTAAQAANWLRYMRGSRLGLHDGYSVARHNCRTFSQWEFRDAPSHW
jgi:hypothetical protein